MKKIICLLLAAFTLAAMLPMGALAAENPEETVSCIYYEDGSYLKITVTATESVSRATIGKSGSKKMEHYNSDGELCWTIVLKGTFTYNGTTSACTASSCDVTISRDTYYMESKTVSKSGSSAYATVVIGRDILGAKLFKETYELTLSCDKNGNLS